MSTTPILIGAISGLTRQAGDTIRMSADGIVEAMVSYKCPSSIYVANLPAPLQAHPDFASLLLFEFSGVREDGEIYRFDYIYKGVFGSENLFALMQENVTVNTTQEPIETLYKFAYPFDSPPVSTAQLAVIQQAMENNIQDITTMSSTAAPFVAGSPAWTLWKLKRMGVESYLRPGVTAQLRFVAAASSGAPISGDYLNKVGTTDHVTTAWGHARSIPATAGSRTWLFSGVSWTLMGNALTVTEDHMLSGPTAWIPYIYTP